MNGEIPTSLGEGTFGVAYGERSAWVVDTLTGTRIVIYYHPFHRKWYIMLTDPEGNFVKRLKYISVCAVGVYEYCRRSHEGGNLYVDVLYCEPISELELDSYWQPWEGILLEYRRGNRRPYYRWLRAILPDVAQYIARRIRETGEMTEAIVVNVITNAFGVDVEYIGYLVTGTKFCSKLLYGIYCRMDPLTCKTTRCKSICRVVQAMYPDICSDARERECLAGEIWKPMSRYEYRPWGK